MAGSPVPSLLLESFYFYDKRFTLATRKNQQQGNSQPFNISVLIGPC